MKGVKGFLFNGIQGDGGQFSIIRLRACCASIFYTYFNSTWSNYKKNGIDLLKKVNINFNSTWSNYKIRCW